MENNITSGFMQPVRRLKCKECGVIFEEGKAYGYVCPANANGMGGCVCELYGEAWAGDITPIYKSTFPYIDLIKPGFAPRITPNVDSLDETLKKFRESESIHLSDKDIERVANKVVEALKEMKWKLI